MKRPNATEPHQDDPQTAFASLVWQSVPSTSRRDLLRAGSLLAGAAAIGIGGIGQRPSLAKAQGDTGEGELRLPFYPFGQAIETHPHRAPNWGPFWVLLPHVWVGLLGFDENGGVVLDLAESVEPNDTADSWTCTIKSDLAFSSGTAVTANSFIASWTAALNPESPAPMASFMFDVRGAREFAAGEPVELGFTAVDDRTIQIDLARPNSSFPAALATFVWALTEEVHTGATPSPDTISSGLGIWKIAAQDDAEIVFEVNPASPVPPPSSINRVVWVMYDGPDASTNAIADFVNGSLAVADVPQSQMASVTGDEAIAGQLVTIASQASTMAIGMDFAQPPFDQPDVRRAIALAVDRDTWATSIWEDEFVAAASVVPPVVTHTSDYAPASLLAFDAGEARTLIEESDLGRAENATEVVYYQDANAAPDTIDKHAALLKMIEDNCGLAIRHDTSLTQEQIDALRTDNGGSQFDIVWWWTTSNTASMLETIGATTGSLMAGRFNWSPDLEADALKDAAAASKAFNEAIVAANSAIDPAAMNNAFADGEQLLVDNVVYVPLGHWVQRFVQSPRLEGTRQGPWSGSLPVRIDAEVSLKPAE